MEFIIREATKEDINQIQDVANTSWQSTYEGIIPYNIQQKFLSFAYSDEMMEKRIDGSFLLVAETNHQIVGFANFTPVNKEGQSELSAIYLYPNQQGKGIGTALLNKGLEILTNVKEIYINVEKENDIGKSFYEAKGFDIIKEFDDDFDGHILKTIRMCLTV